MFERRRWVKVIGKLCVGVVSFIVFLSFASTSMADAGTRPETVKKQTNYLYYPDYALPHYRYENRSQTLSGPMMVVPKSVPVVVQPSLLAQSIKYSVHTGSFLEFADVDLMEEQLKKLSLPTFRNPITKDGITYTQLHVGPFTTLKQAKEAALLVKKDMNVQGVLFSVKY